jgi:hypothetical protein
MIQLSSVPHFARLERDRVMASFQTFFRTVVMLATLGLVAKAWYLYGPSVDEMKKIGARVAEVTSQTWNEYWQKPADAPLSDDPRLPRLGGAPAPFVPQGGPMEPMPHGSTGALQPISNGTVQLVGGMPAEIVPVPSPGPSSAWPPTSPPEPTRLPPNNSLAANSSDAQLAATLEQLTQLGVRDPELSAWGSGGNLMRFSCNMPWANSPAYSRHFEAVAATSLEAVQQVSAEIDAWRNGQR